VDLVLFDAAIARGDLDSLETAARLCRGPLLPACPEDWVVPERARREQAYLQALETLAAAAGVREEHAAAARYLRLAIAVDPLRESAQRALMAALAAGGEPAAATMVYRDFRRLLHREVNAVPEPETEALFQELRARAHTRRHSASLTAARPTPNAQRPTPHRPTPGDHLSNLPRPLSRFVGRERERQEVAASLAEAPLVTLTGPGGVGKTRLALQVAAECAADYPDGVWFVDLARLADPALVPQAVAAALAVREEPERPLTETLQAFLHDKHLLLLLDNCEHLLVACAELAEALLSHCPELKILVTSRQSLGITGEITRALRGLSVPATVESQWLRVESADMGTSAALSTLNAQLSSLLEYEAVRLFVERAAAATFFALTGTNARSVVQICERLDGIPLAIELAAARLKALSPHDIAARLDDRFRLLTGGSRTALPRQQTLRATLDWSYDLLTAAERTLLGRLSVFAGDWTLEAAEAICSDCGSGTTYRDGQDRQDRGADLPVGGFAGLSSGAPSAHPVHPVHPCLNSGPQSAIRNEEVLDLLTQLVDKSWVMVEGRDGELRYRLLETVREYAAAQVGEVEQEGGAWRHAHYYLALAEHVAPLLAGPEQSAGQARLGQEYENLRSALAWAQTRGEEEIALRLGAALWWFWWLQGYLREGRDRLAEVLALPRVQASSVARAQALLGAGRIIDALGDMAAARSFTTQSLAVWQEVGDQHGIADTLNQLGDLQLDRDGFQAAQERYEGALALYRELQDRSGIAQTLYNLGHVEWRQGNADIADRLLAECRQISRELGDRATFAAAASRQGWVAQARGDVTRARSLFEESLALRRELGVKQPIAWSLLDMVQAARLQNDLDAARAAAAEALAICREMDHWPGIGWALSELGDVEYAQGEIEAAAALYEESLAVAQKLGNTRGIAGLLISLGRVALRRAEIAVAGTRFTEALALQRQLGNRLGEAWALEGLAEVAAAREQPEQATRLLAAAERVWEQLPGKVPSLDPGSAEALRACLHSRLGEEAFTALWESGRAVSEGM
jgi:predicted ATPase